MSFLKPRRESVQKGTKKCNYTVKTLMEAVEAEHRAADVYSIEKLMINNHVKKRVNKV